MHRHSSFNFRISLSPETYYFYGWNANILVDLKNFSLENFFPQTQFGLRLNFFLNNFFFLFSFRSIARLEIFEIFLFNVAIDFIKGDVSFLTRGGRIALCLVVLGTFFAKFFCSHLHHCFTSAHTLL